MKKRIISIILLLAYVALLIKVMVFKSLPTIRVGQLMLNFAGTDAGHGPNFTPFATIGPYLMGYKGWIIAGINLAGNIILLVPLGFLLPFIFPHITWKKSLVLAIASGLFIETMQTVLRVGIFDIDDVILNALGFMIGYWAFIYLTKWLHERSYIKILATMFVVAAAAFAAFYFVYPWNEPLDSQAAVSDLCGGTGGIGQVSSVASNSFTLKLKDDSSLLVNSTSDAVIKTSAGTIAISDLKVGERVTLVGDANHDGTFTAGTVLVCD